MVGTEDRGVLDVGKVFEEKDPALGPADADQVGLTPDGRGPSSPGGVGLGPTCLIDGGAEITGGEGLTWGALKPL